MKSTLRWLLVLPWIAVVILAGANAAFAGDFEYRSGNPDRPHIPDYGIFAPTDATYYHSLSGRWHLQHGEDESYQVDVPGCWASGAGDISLSTTFRIPEEMEGRYLYLVFWGARRHLSVKVNGRLVEAWDADWPSFVVELPKWLLRFDRPNDLEVEINDELSARTSIPLKPKLYDPIPYAGLFSDVALIAGPTAGVEDIEWNVELNDDYSRADWTLSFGMRNHRNSSVDSATVRNLDVWIDWSSPNGAQRGRSETVLVALDPVELVSAKVSGVIQSPKLWSLDDPNLYEFHLNLRENDSTWSIPLRFGIDELIWQPEGLLLNGKRMQVRGIDVRQETIQNGIALTEDRIREDLELVRSLGFNLVRIIGDPPHPATARICDELGLLFVPQLGLRGVPENIFLFEPFKARVGKMLEAMVRRESMHPSVAGWGVVDWAPTSDAFVEGVAQIRERITPLDKRPLIIGFAANHTRELPDGIVGIAQRPPYDTFEPISPLRARSVPWLTGGLGAFATRSSASEDSVRGQVRQSDALLHQLRDARSMPVAGFVIDAYADRLSAMPLLNAGGEIRNQEIARGLMTEAREKRIAWQKVGDALGQLRIEAPTLDIQEPDFPIIFPLVTMAVGGFLLLMMRQNNVFRQNLQRVFAHTHGFFVDIRDKRYFQSGQTFLVALLFSAGQAIITASWLHHSRHDFALDYLITLVLPFYGVKYRLVEWAWHPLQGILAFTVINFATLILIALVIRIISMPFRGTISLKQSFSLVAWASTNYLILIPLGLIHYRFLDFSWFAPAVLILYVLFTFWFILRLVSMIRIGFRVTLRSAWLVFIFVLLIFSGTLAVLYRSGFAIPEYIDFYTNVIAPWIRG